jgi:hypothetical protein
MAFDIYGSDLRRGYCEVHPHVQQEYPCDLCYSKSRRQEQQRIVRRPQFTGENVRVVIDELVKRVPRTELQKDVLYIDFGGNYLIQITKETSPIDHSEFWHVTNAMNGYGHNCLEEFEKCDVTIINN